MSTLFEINNCEAKAFLPANSDSHYLKKKSLKGKLPWPTDMKQQPNSTRQETEKSPPSRFHALALAFRSASPGEDFMHAPFDRGRQMKIPFIAKTLECDFNTLHDRPLAFVAALSVLYRQESVSVSDVIKFVSKDTKLVLRPSYSDKLLNKMVKDELATCTNAGKRGSPRLWFITQQGRSEFETIVSQEVKKATYLQTCVQPEGPLRDPDDSRKSGDSQSPTVDLSHMENSLTDTESKAHQAETD